MPNATHPINDPDPSGGGSSGSPALGGAPGPGAVVEFRLQPAGLVPEQVLPLSVIQLVLGRTTALASWRDGPGTSQRVPFSTESVWLLPAATPHAAHWHEAVPVLRISLCPDFVRAVLPDSTLRPRIVRLVDLIRMDWTAFVITTELHAALKNGTAPPLSEQRALELADRILRALHGPDSFCRSSGLTDERFHAVTDFIEENLTLKFSREFLAKTDGQSLHHFARMFKARTGSTPREYVDRRRCFRARVLIESGVRQVDAAMEVGFGDQPDMCDKFNRVFGCPPGTFAPENGP